MNFKPRKRASFSRTCRTYLVILASAVIGCFGLPLKDEKDYGLVLVSLKVKAEELGLLNSQIQSKRPVKSEAKIPGRWQGDCMISSAGRSSLDNFRRSLQLSDCDNPLEERSSYRVSAQSVDATMLRSRLGYPIFSFLQLLVPKVESASAYLNKDYLGLYVLLETIDREFFKVRDYEIKEVYKARYGNAGFKEEFNARLPEAFSYEGKPDDFSLLRALYDTVTRDSSDATFYAELDKMLDIDSFLRYVAAAIYTSHWDGMNNNYYLVMDRRKEKLFVVPWDLDRIWERTDILEPEDFPSLNRMFERLLALPAMRQRLHELLTQLEKEFPLQRLYADLDKMSKEVAAAYAADPSLALRPQEEVIGELKARIESWHTRVSAYNARLLPAPR